MRDEKQYLSVATNLERSGEVALRNKRRCLNDAWRSNKEESRVDERQEEVLEDGAILLTSSDQPASSAQKCRQPQPPSMPDDACSMPIKHTKAESFQFWIVCVGMTFRKFQLMQMDEGLGCRSKTTLFVRRNPTHLELRTPNCRLHTCSSY